MSYENAPATKLLATHCACCARPLVDSVSVETGIGPDCRKKHGYGSAQTDADWAATSVALGNFEGWDAATTAAWGSDAQKVANQLVYLVALGVSGPAKNDTETAKAVNGIRALGFSRLADVISKRMAHVVIVRDGGELVVRTPYSPETIVAFRAVPGRRWDAEAKRNRFPETSARALFNALAKCYPGARVAGPKGLFILPVAV